MSLSETTTARSRTADLATTAQPLTRLGGIIFPPKGTVAAQLLVRAAAANRGSGKKRSDNAHYHNRQGGFMGSKYKTFRCVYKSCNALGYVVVYTHDFNTKKGLHMCKKHAEANGQPILW